MSQPLESLMRATLLEVFGERDPELRLAAIRRTYTEDVVFSDRDEVITGHAALDAKAQKLLDEAPGFVFSPVGPAHVAQDLGHQAWAFGPPGQDPVVTGMDIGLARDGRLASLYTILT